jgi:hypothetical protein
MAGDDIWIVCRRDLALPFAARAGRNFNAKTSASTAIRNALLSVGQDGPLTLTFGVVFAKCKFPFDASLDLAEQLLHQAKQKRRASPAPPEGWIDFHWLAGSGRESSDQTRRLSESYMDGGQVCHLYTRPCVLSTLEMYFDACARLKEFPSRKLHQLDQILRLGRELSELAYWRWWTRLDPKEKAALRAALSDLQWPVPPEKGPPDLWRPCEGGWETAIAELALVKECHE